MNNQYIVIPKGTIVNTESIPWILFEDHALLTHKRKDNEYSPNVDNKPNDIDGYPVLVGWDSEGLGHISLVHSYKDPDNIVKSLNFDQMMFIFTEWIKAQKKSLIERGTTVNIYGCIISEYTHQSRGYKTIVLDNNLEYWDLDILLPLFVRDPSLSNVIDFIGDNIADVGVLETDKRLSRKYGIYPCKYKDMFILYEH